MWPAPSGAIASAESGAVYGQDGRYGCYFTTCLGGTVDAEIASFASVGFYTSVDDFNGTSVAVFGEAGELVSFSTSQVYNLQGRSIGSEECFSLELSLLPITAGVYQCSTAIDVYDVGGGGTVTTTTTLAAGSSTTRTLPSVLPPSLPELLAFLGSSLPVPGDSRPAAKLARKLRKQHRRTTKRILRALRTDPDKTRKRAELFRRGVRQVSKLLDTATGGMEEGRLTVPLLPIESLSKVVLERLDEQVQAAQTNAGG